MPGPWELFLIILVVLILFGGKRLPELAKNIGKGLREFKGAMAEAQDEARKGVVDSPKNSSGASDTKPGSDA